MYSQIINFFVGAFFVHFQILFNITPHSAHKPLLIFMHDVIILTQNEAMGNRPPPLAVAAPIASFWVSIVTYHMHKY